MCDFFFSSVASIYIFMQFLVSLRTFKKGVAFKSDLKERGAETTQNSASNNNNLDPSEGGALAMRKKRKFFRASRANSSEPATNTGTTQATITEQHKR